MMLIAYTRINVDAELDALFERVQNAFSRPENQAYIGEIKYRKNLDGARESLYCLLVLSELLKNARADASSLILDRLEGGKPHFENSRIEFSLSHSHGYAAAAISDESNVGIDVEAAEISPEKADKLAKRFFTEDEKQAIEADPDSFLRLWTIKEAYAKMQGTPLSELIANEKKTPDNKRDNAYFCELSADGHPLTVCLEKSCEITCLGEINV